jgi:hypothetical protein
MKSISVFVAIGLAIGQLAAASPKVYDINSIVLQLDDHTVILGRVGKRYITAMVDSTLLLWSNRQ